eukprot:gene1385-2132_t
MAEQALQLRQLMRARKEEKGDARASAAGDAVEQVKRRRLLAKMDQRDQHRAQAQQMNLLMGGDEEPAAPPPQEDPPATTPSATQEEDSVSTSLVQPKAKPDASATAAQKKQAAIRLALSRIGFFDNDDEGPNEGDEPPADAVENELNAIVLAFKEAGVSVVGGIHVEESRTGKDKDEGAGGAGEEAKKRANQRQIDYELAQFHKELAEREENEAEASNITDETWAEYRLRDDLQAVHEDVRRIRKRRDEILPRHPGPDAAASGDSSDASSSSGSDELAGFGSWKRNSLRSKV